MLTSLVRITLFAAVSLAPLLSLTMGAVEPYGSEHPIFPELTALLHGRPGAFDELGEAVLHRSLATREAIALKSTLAVDVFHYVDSVDVISGRGDWLFLKSELQSCIPRGRAAIAMAHIDVLADMGRAAGVDVLITMSPDKSAIYPEALNPWARPYWECKAHNSALIDRYARERAGRFLNHSEAMHAEREAHPNRSLYFHTDTHWTPYGAAIALRHLLVHAFPHVPAETIPAPRLAGTTALHTTDLRSVLRVSGDEPYAELDPAVENSLGALNPDDPARTVILRDSFYRTFVPTLYRTFPGMKLFMVENQSEYEQAISEADRVIANSVERKLVPRALGGPFSNRSGMMRGLLRRNARMAGEGCSAFDVVGPDAIVFEVDEPDSFRGELEVPAVGDGEQPCIKLELNAAAEGALEIFLPVNSPKQNYESGRSVFVPYDADTRWIVLGLPAHVGGHTIAIGHGATPASRALLRAVSLGVMREPETPATRNLRASAGGASPMSNTQVDARTR